MSKIIGNLLYACMGGAATIVGYSLWFHNADAAIFGGVLLFIAIGLRFVVAVVEE